jgi:hypothetical protein
MRRIIIEEKKIKEEKKNILALYYFIPFKLKFSRVCLSKNSITNINK